MTEDMNRFAFNTEGKICDYGYEEPKVLSEQEILEELNRLDQANYELSSECTSVNWTNECLQEQVDTYVKLLACKDSYENRIDELKKELTLTEKAFKLAVFELDFYKNHSQSTNQECLKRIERLETEILNKTKEMLKSE